jgi:Glyoxalase-like domain
VRRENQLSVATFDAAELAEDSRSWAGVLGGTVDVDDDWHMVLVDGMPRVGVQLAPEHIPPDWPDGNPQQIHLDLWVDDIETAHEEVMALGAKVLKQADSDRHEADNFQVYADPAGPSLLPVLGDRSIQLTTAPAQGTSLRITQWFLPLGRM